MFSEKSRNRYCQSLALASIQFTAVLVYPLCVHEIDADTVETCHRSCANETALLFRSQILSSWIYDFPTFQEDLNAPFNLLHFTDNYNKAFVRRELVRTDAIFIFILIKKRLWGINLQSVKWVVLLLVNEIWLFKNSGVQKKNLHNCYVMGWFVKI